MAGTLLIGNPNTSWREWLKEHRGNRDLICLDPSDPVHGTPTRFSVFKKSRPVFVRFYGSLDPSRFPHVLLATLAQALQIAEPDALVQLFPYRATPLLRHTLMLVAQVMQPDQILIAEGTEIDQSGFPIGPESVELEKAFLPMVQDAQRKAQWLKLVEDCDDHDIDLATLSIEGTRLGSGVRLNEEEKKKVGLEDALHVEKIGGSLFIVSEDDPEDRAVAHAQDMTGTHRANFVSPHLFEGLLCSFARQSGEDFGMGLIDRIDWLNRRASILCTAVAPAPVRILRLGSLRIDTAGRELGEVRPWQV